MVLAPIQQSLGFTTSGAASRAWEDDVREYCSTSLAAQSCQYRDKKKSEVWAE